MTLSAGKIDSIIQNMKTLHFRNCEIVYKEGNKNISIYLIYKGEVKLIKKIKNGEFNIIGKFNEFTKRSRKNKLYRINKK